MQPPKSSHRFKGAPRAAIAAGYSGFWMLLGIWRDRKKETRRPKPPRLVDYPTNLLEQQPQPELDLALPV